MQSIRDKIAGKVLGYYLNAYYDARLARDLWDYEDGNKGLDSLTDRAQGIINNLHASVSLESVAYCYYQWNGFYDLMWARFWSLFINEEKRSKIKDSIDNYKRELDAESAYREFGNSLILFSPILMLLVGRLYKYKGDSSRREVYKGIVYVQWLNIRHNLMEVKKMKSNKGGNEKLNFVKDLGIDSYNKKSVSRALIWASVWDVLFAGLILFRFLILLLIITAVLFFLLR